MGAKAHAFVADVEAPALSPADRHHFERVLRLAPGEAVSVSDGGGRWRLCRWTGVGDGIEPAGAVVVERAPSPVITVAFALTKGERPEWTVQKLTELGVDRIVPFVAARSVVRWEPERAAAHAERWRRVAREAASQSRRAWLPVVEEVSTFEAVASQRGAVLADLDGGPPGSSATTVLVGPEGGWSDDERASAAASGLSRIRLGDHVLRAETAAMAAGALLIALRAGLVGPS